MAQVIWAEPPLRDLDTIAEYIALDNPESAKNLVRKAFEKTDQLIEFPESGSKPRELKNTPYRRLSISPILIYYRIEGSKVLITHVTRGDRKFSFSRILGNEN